MPGSRQAAWESGSDTTVSHGCPAGTAQEDGEAHGQVQEDQLVHGVSSEGGADRERDEARLEQADGDGRADTEHGRLQLSMVNFLAKSGGPRGYKSSTNSN